MDDGLKQRIIGAVVLIAIAVIFIPILFDREKITPVDTRTQIPPIPHIEKLEIEEPIRDLSEEQAKPPEDVFVPDTNNVQPETAETPGLNTRGLPNAWVLQVASFLHSGHAKQLRDDLIEAGHDAYMREVIVNHRKMVRVYIGPKVEKSRLLSIKKIIDKKYESDSILLKFEP